MRELTGGVYFGEPKDIADLEDGHKRAIDTQVYTTGEIDRIARRRLRPGAHPQQQGVLGREEQRHEVRRAVGRGRLGLDKDDSPTSSWSMCWPTMPAMQLVRNPKQFDVIVTDNLFGDILSDVAAMLTGSLGMLPSASLGAPDPATGKRKAIYEPVHGSAPDIAGKGLANPIAMIASFAMALRYSFDLAAKPTGSTGRSPTCWPPARAPKISPPQAPTPSAPRRWATPSSRNSRLYLARRNAQPRGTRGRHVQRDRREWIARAHERTVDGIGQNSDRAETFAVVPWRHDHGRGLPGGRIAIYRADRHHIAGDRGNCGAALQPDGRS